MSRFWPARETPQLDYEALREAAIAGVPLAGEAAARFEARGLAGLVCARPGELIFEAVLLGARRPAWTPYVDPRLDALAAGYALLLAHPDRSHREEVLV
ncbi:MAG: hypothetical protein HY775_01940 [Acidobacteria bacterium]|nr:hypothetical protein [Acidobacteriota bacterium]